MNYTKFLKEFGIATAFVSTSSYAHQKPTDSREQLLQILGNTVTAKWAYRIFNIEMAESFTKIVESFFLEYSGRIEVFGWVWNGLLLAEDKNNREQVLLFEPESAQVFEIPGNLEYFHNIQIIKNRWPLLREHLYKEWIGKNRSIPNIRECIGYKKPLFLGGMDEVSNLELIDMEVYWSVTWQLWNAVKDLPPGTSIWNVSISE